MIFSEDEILYFENLDLENIKTPVNADKLDNLLMETGYDKAKKDFLVDGFKHGFDLGYRGPKNIKQKAPNLKFSIGNETELWNKVMKEVQLERYAGPFEEIPFDNYIQSPIGLVPKDGGTKTRLIFHLSYPRTGEGISVNSSTPTEMTHVKYASFDDAVRLCILDGKGCKAGKSDMSAAFRHLGMKKEFWKYLVMKAKNPKDKKWYYFVDKCMPFGASISCANFQAFSDAISYIVEQKMKKWNINYLDDFFFTGMNNKLCDRQIRCFLDICEEINFPVAKEKTFWSCTRITFLGLLIDTILQKIFIPTEKIDKALEAIEFMLTKKNKKIRMKKLQQLTGLLNFLGKSIIPGRAFTRRFYAYTKSTMKPHHHLKIKGEIRADLEMWKTFLLLPNVYSRNFIDLDNELTAEKISMYSDASANSQLGCGGISEQEWFILQWDEEFIETNTPSINYLELYAVTVAVLLWIENYRNKKIILFCDNMSVVQMINNTSSKCQNCMVLIRILVLHGLVHNVQINANHVPGKSNTYSDFLSRLKYDKFRKQARLENRKFNNKPRAIPEQLWPMEKLWIKKE